MKNSRTRSAPNSRHGRCATGSKKPRSRWPLRRTSTTATIRPSACRPISIVSAISLCAARPISITYKKRAAREKEEAIKYANSSLLERLIAIVDNFELGLSAAKSEGEQSPDLLRDEHGLETADRFPGRERPPADRRRGAKVRSRICTKQSRMSRATTSPEGVVMRQMRRGYRLKDRLLRPSSVVVSSGHERASDE